MQPMPGQQPQQMYGQPQAAPMGQTVIIQQPTGNGMAVTGGVMGILTWVFFLLGLVIGFTMCLTPITMLLGIIFSHIGLSGSKRSGVGGGWAVTGLILNYLYLIAIIALFVLFGAAIASMGA
ncbi:MAG: hypothetical protein QGG96_00165 [Candidatus Poseidoniaceae archaeon]|nr:hypothetical protein [Candidatus Poseidoniaceae archaeon]